MNKEKSALPVLLGIRGAQDQGRNVSQRARSHYFFSGLCSLSCREHCHPCPGVSHMLQPEGLSFILHGKQEVSPQVGVQLQWVCLLDCRGSNLEGRLHSHLDQLA